MKKYEKILQAEILTEKKNSVKLTLKGGQELVGKSGGIFDDETDEGDFVGYVMLFYANQLESPVFLRDEDIVNVEATA